MYLHHRFQDCYTGSYIVLLKEKKTSSYSHIPSRTHNPMATWKIQLLIFIISTCSVSTTTELDVDKDDDSDCARWEETIECRFPCSYFNKVCLGRYVMDPARLGVESTNFTCTWKPIPGIIDYGIVLKKTKFHNGSKCFQDVECGGADGSSTCSGTLLLHANNTDCQPYFHDSTKHNYHITAYRNKHDLEMQKFSSNDQKSLCKHAITSHTCNLVDFKATTVNIMRKNNNSANIIEVEMRAPECLIDQMHSVEMFNHLQIEYKVDYWKVGKKDSSLKSVSVGSYHSLKGGYENTTQFKTLQLDEATLYNIEVRYIVPGAVLVGNSRIRGAAVTPYLTAPCTAADIRPLRSEIAFACLPSSNQNMMEISWKKTGQIDSGFTVIETRTKGEDGRLVKTTMQQITPINNTIGNNLRVSVSDYNPNMDYNVTVTSRNGAGESKPTNAVLSYPVCQIKKDYRIGNCSVIQTNTTSAEISWQSQSLSPKSYLLSIYDNVIYSTKDVEINSNTTRIMLYELKMCVVYQLSVHSKLYGQLVDTCVLNHMQITDDPDYSVLNITRNTAQIEMTSNCSQAHYSYEAHGPVSKKAGGGWIGASFKMTDLTPYTDYKLKIWQTYLDKKGNYKESFFVTKEQAPSNAPDFKITKTEYSKNDYNLTWTEPEKSNGVITLYVLQIYNNKVNNHISQCKAVGSAIVWLCMFPNTTHTLRLNMSVFTGIKMKACTQTVDDTESEFCSEWSESYTIKLGQTTNYMWIVLLALGSSIPFIGMFCHYRYKSKNYNIQPKIDKEILDSFKLTGSNHNNSRGTSDTFTVSYTTVHRQDDTNVTDDELGDNEHAGEECDPVDEWRRELKNAGGGDDSVKKKFERQQSGITSTGSGNSNVATTNEWMSAATPYLQGFNMDQLDMMMTSTHQINDDFDSRMLPTTSAFPQPSCEGQTTESTDDDVNETSKFLPTTQPSPIFPYKTLDTRRLVNHIAESPPTAIRHHQPASNQTQVESDVNLDYFKDSDIMTSAPPPINNGGRPVMYEQDIFPQPTMFSGTDNEETPPLDTKGYTSLNAGFTTNDDAAPFDSYFK